MLGSTPAASSRRNASTSKALTAAKAMLRRVALWLLFKPGPSRPKLAICSVSCAARVTRCGETDSIALQQASQSRTGQLACCKTLGSAAALPPTGVLISQTTVTRRPWFVVGYVLVAPLSFPSPRDGHQRVHVVRGERRVLGGVLHPAINRIEDLCENQPVSQGTKRFATPSGTCWCFAGRSCRGLSGTSLGISTPKKSAASCLNLHSLN